MSCFLSEYREIRKENKSKIKVFFKKLYLSQDENTKHYFILFNFFLDMSIKYEMSMHLFIDVHTFVNINFIVDVSFIIDNFCVKVNMQVRNLISGAENGF